MRTGLVVAILLFFIGLPQFGPTAVGDSMFPFTFTDDLGRTITLEAPAQRIVSLVPSYSQVIFAIGAEDTLVGVTRFDDYPPELVEKVNQGMIRVVGGGFDPDFEVVVVLEPDIVLGNGPSHREAIRRLEDLGLQVIYLNPETIAGIFDRILLLGKITAHESDATRLVEGMNARIGNIKTKVEALQMRARVYVEVWNDPLISVGPGTLSNELIAAAGGTNIFADSSIKFPVVSPEEVIARDPEVIILIHAGSVDEVKQRPGFELVTAVRNNRVFQIIPRLFSPGPSIVDGLEAVARAINPDLVGEVTLSIVTNPRMAGVQIYVDGQLHKTTHDGTVSVTVVTGRHVIVLVNTTVTRDDRRHSFSSWSGAASGSVNPLNIQLLTNSTLNINYSQCIIATVAYGSELADEVQVLREFRDRTVLSTRAGRAFMQTFDSWYYSFSPAFAERLSQNEVLKSVTRVFLYPLISILDLADNAYYLTGGNPEVRVVAAGAVANFLTGNVYFTPVALALQRVRRLRFLLRSYAICATFAIAVASLAAVAILVMGPATTALGLATVVFAVSTIVGGSLVGARLALRALFEASLVIRRMFP